MSARAPSFFFRALGIGAALWLLAPDALFALAFGFTRLGLWGGGLDVVYPDAARAIGVGRLALLAAATACVCGLEKRRGFFREESGRGLALYDFPKRAAGGFSIAGIFAYTLGIMLHFFEAWSVAAVLFAVMLGAILSFHVLGAMASDGGGASESGELPLPDNWEIGGV